MSSSDSESREQVRVDPYTLEATAARRHMQGKTAAQEGGFFRPYLKPGMRVLDAGCGGGSITFGLAEIVAPGEVIGLDANDPQIQAATKLANDRDLKNVHFQQGSVYGLPFPDSSFDAVFGNGLLEHLNEPERALGEFHRVLKSPGVVGVRSCDYRGQLLEPADPVLLESTELFGRIRAHHGGNVDIGSEIMRLLRKSGFVDVDAGATYTCYASMDAKHRFAQMAASINRESSARTEMLELGWVDSDKLENWAQAWLAWAENPDAFHARSWVHGVGHKR